jgi:hypothetical protein
MCPVWDVDRDFYEWIYDSLLYDLVTRGIFETGELLG